MAQNSAITFHGRTITAVPVSLGVQFDTLWHTGGDVTFAPLARLAWVHDFAPDRDIARSFKELPSLIISRITLPVDADTAPSPIKRVVDGRAAMVAEGVRRCPGFSCLQHGRRKPGLVWNVWRRWSVDAWVGTTQSSQADRKSGKLSVRRIW